MQTLAVKARELGSYGALQDARADKLIPAVVYGPETDSTPLLVERVPFDKMLHAVGRNTLIQLEAGDKKFIVVIKDVQRNPITGEYTHVDFFAMSMKKEMEAEVELRFVGESVAVKDLGGTLIKAKDALNVSCLPKDLPAFLEVSIAALAGFDDVIAVKDIVLPAGVTALDGAEETIAKVATPLTEEQLKAMEAENAGDVTKVEVVGEKKEDEDEEEKGKSEEKSEKPVKK